MTDVSVSDLHTQMEGARMDTKQLIIDAARKVIGKKGFAGTRISDIVSAAGLAQGTFYLYFKNKQDIIEEIGNQMIAMQSEKIKAFEDIGNVITRDEFIRKIYEVFDSYMIFFQNNADILRVLAIEVEPASQPMIMDIIARIHKAFVRFFKIGRDNGITREMDYDSIAQLTIMAVMQFFFSTITKASDFPSTEKIRSFVEMCLFGIMVGKNA